MNVSIVAIVVVVAVVLMVVLMRRGGPRRIGLDPGRAETARRRLERSGVELAPGDAAEVAGLLARGRKIEAIKLVRERTGLGLKEAKEFVEHHDFGGDR